MNIPKNIAKRIAKFNRVRPELTTPFIQGEYEYITNTFFMVKVPKTPEQKEDFRKLPNMAMAEKNNTENLNKPTSVGIGHLIDTLEILKANGVKFVDISTGERAIKVEGFMEIWQVGKPTASAVLMAIVDIK